MRSVNSPRQDRVLSLLKAGLSIPEIANRDGASPRAIRHLLRRMNAKAENRLQRKLRRLAAKYHSPRDEADQ